MGQLIPKYPKAVFMDLGANIGVYTVSAAILGYKVMAFEPIRDTLTALTQTVAANNLQSNVEVFPYGLLDKRYKSISAELTSGMNNHGATKLLVDTACNHPSDVQIATLDDLLPYMEKTGIKQVVMKMDMEGSEPRAIMGGLKFMEQIDIPFIIMEFHNIAATLRGDPWSDDFKMAAMFLKVMDKKFTPHSLASDKWMGSVKDAYLWEEDILWRKK